MGGVHSASKPAVTPDAVFVLLSSSLPLGIGSPVLELTQGTLRAGVYGIDLQSGCWHNR